MMKTFKFITLVSCCFALFSCQSKGLKYDASGVFEVTEVIVSAQGVGEIKALGLDEGDQLSLNQEVGWIDTLQLSLKKNQLLAAKGSVLSRKMNPVTQIAAIKQEIEKQKRERIRFERLVKADAANQKQLDDIESALSVLEKQLAAQNETLYNTNNSLSDESISMQAQIEQINDQIQNSIITSPISGVVLSKYAEVGELAMQGKPLFKLADMKTMYLRAYIVGSQLTEIKLGQEVEVYSDLGKSEYKSYKGKITWISDKAEFTPKTIQTRDERANLVYAIKVLVENDGFIKRGMYGEVKF